MKQFLIFVLLITTQVQAQLVEQWARSYSSKGDYSAKFTCIAKDNSGNFYIGGYTVNIDNNRDYLVAKVNTSGDTVWTKTFTGTDNSGDEVTAIAVDKNANVYVTGFANGKGTGNDILTIKMNNNGDTLWTRFYNYTANDDDNGNALAIDTAGNVFVCGESDGNATNIDNLDFVTIKYNANGTLAWANRYGGAGTDRAEKIVTDPAGNCYVTGRTYNGLNDNYVTVKYNASGAQQWLKTYDGGNNDRASCIAIDSSYAAVYVSGRSDNGGDDDIITIKYSTAAGTIGWTKSYNNVDDDRAMAITADAAGNIYVTGESDADASANRNWNMVTVKYASTSVQQWVRTYNSSLTLADIPVAISVNASGDVFVAGQSDVDPSATADNYNFNTLKYNSSGTFQWSKTLLGTGISTGGAKAMVLDAAGLPIIVGSLESAVTQKDAKLLRYDAAGTEVWNKTYFGSGDNSDNAYKIVVDAAGNSYVAGYSINEETDRNMTVAKLNSLGDTQWVRKYNGTSSISLDAANDLLVDASGNVFATGSTKNSNAGNDFTTLKYNSNGDSVWIKKYNNTLVNGSDKSNAIAQDAAGNTYVAGYSETNNSGISDDFLTIKYDALGNQIWAQKFNGTGNGEDRAYFIKVNGTQVYVGGKTWNGGDYDYSLQIYTLSGAFVGAGTYSSGLGDDVPAAMEIDANGNVFMTGKSAAPTGNILFDYATVKFSASGTLLWIKRYDGSSNQNDEANALALDQAGNVFVTGFCNEDNSVLPINTDFATIAYNTNGDTLWTRIFSGTAGLKDVAKAICTDPLGAVYVTGESNVGTALNPNMNIITLKYLPTGTMVLNAEYNGTGNGQDSPNSICFRDDNVFVCGETFSGTATQKDMVVLKYDDFTLGLDAVSVGNKAIAAYPNPASNHFSIDLSGIAKSINQMEFKLFTASGALVLTQNASGRTKLSVQTNQLPAGNYYFRIDSNGSVIGKGKITLQ